MATVISSKRRQSGAQSSTAPQGELSVAPIVAPVQEVFSSIQGEGVYIGKRQLFVRFAHCHLKCAYCDTPMTSPTGDCHVHWDADAQQEEMIENPVDVDSLNRVITQFLSETRHHSVSFTGGEPLLYHHFLKELLPKVQKKAPTYLETSGTQPAFLQPLLQYINILAMDIKLPSATHEPPQFGNHKEFYALAKTAPRLEIFIKLILNDDTPDDELAAVFDIVTDRNVPIILQPETSLDDGSLNASPKRLLDAEVFLSRVFGDVRVIPQTHKTMNLA